MTITSTTRNITATRIHPRLTAALLLAIVGTVVPAVLVLFSLSQSRYRYQVGVEQLNRNELRAAEQSLVAAAGLYPEFLRRSLEDPTHRPSILNNDLQRLALATGHLAFKRAAELKEAQAFQQEMAVAESRFRIAHQLNPQDVEALTGLARSVTALEKIREYLSPGEPPGELALPLYEKLLSLRPQGIEAHYLFIHYLYGRKLEDRLRMTVTRMIAIHPPSFPQLTREKFYSAELRYAAQQGLEAAINAGNFVGAAYTGLSAIAVEKGHPNQAVELYERGMQIDPDKDIASQHRHLGGLLLKADQEASARVHFIVALKNSTDRENLLGWIWEVYRQAKEYQKFIELCRMVEAEVPMTELVDILQAVSYGEMGQDELARAHLNQVGAGKYQAEAMYQLALISQKLKDWDGMELASHRATMLDPGKSGYHALFAQSLRNQRKNGPAEAAISKGLSVATTTDPWLYNLRGWTRFDQNNIEGARQDWQKAVELAPKVGHFHRYLALTYEREGDWLTCLAHLKKAVELNPENADYRKALQDLQEKMH